MADTPTPPADTPKERLWHRECSNKSTTTGDSYIFACTDEYQDAQGNSVRFLEAHPGQLRVEDKHHRTLCFIEKSAAGKDIGNLALRELLRAANRHEDLVFKVEGLIPSYHSYTSYHQADDLTVTPGTIPKICEGPGAKGR